MGSFGKPVLSGIAGLLRWLARAMSSMLATRVRKRWGVTVLVVVLLLIAAVPPLVSDDIRSEVKRTWANCGRKLLYHRPLRSDLPFQPAIADADKIVIRDGGYDCCKPNVDLDPVLFTVTNQAEVKEVVAHLKFEPVTIMDSKLESCLCCGSPGMDWYRGNKRIAMTSIQHGHAIRWKGFSTARILGVQVGYGDGLLTRESSNWLVGWFVKHGVTEPKREADIEWEARDKAAARAAERARAATRPQSEASTRPSQL